MVSNHHVIEYETCTHMMHQQSIVLLQIFSNMQIVTNHNKVKPTLLLSNTSNQRNINDIPFIFDSKQINLSQIDDKNHFRSIIIALLFE